MSKANDGANAELHSGSMMALEKRYAFDAAFGSELADMIQHQPIDLGSNAPTVDSFSETMFASIDGFAPDGSNGESAASLIVIDGSLDDISGLVAGLPANSDILILDTTRDGVDQIAEALATRDGVGAVHIFAHGQAGSLNLGSSVLNLQSMNSVHRDALNAVGASLSANADLFVYGCDFADGEVGRAAVEALASLTSADVSASDDLTGAADQGGDWDLEFKLGNFEGQAFELFDYGSTLPTAAISAGSDPTLSGGTNIGATATWSNVAVVGGQAIDIRATVITADPSAYINFGRTGDDLRMELENGNITVRWELFQAGTSTPFTADINFQITDIDGPSLETVSATATATVERNTNLSLNSAGGALTATGTQTQNSESVSMIRFSWANQSSVDVDYSAFTGADIRVFNHDGDLDLVFVDPTVVGNRAPDAVNDTPSTAYQTALTGTVATNDTDPDGDTLTYTQGTGPTNGTLTFNSNGSYTYTPNTGFSGTDSFTYTVNDGRGGTDTATVSIAVAPRPNTAPDAVNDNSTTVGGTPLTGTVAANDTDPDGDTLTYTQGTGPTNGTLVLNTNGTYTYTPNSGFSGTDSFTYTVSDGRGGTDTATVSVTVTPRPNTAPDAVNDTGTTPYQTALTGTVATNDTDPDGDTLTYTQGTGPTNGTLTFNANGSYTYTPNAGYTGTDSFTYTVNDGRGGTDTATVNITVGARPNSTPDAVNDTGTTPYQTALTGTVATNDTDPDGDTLTYTQGTGPTNGTLTFNPNGSYTYTPNAGYAGTDSFTYTVNDGRGGTDTATVNITVGARPNSTPDAVNDTGTTPYQTALTGTVATNDTDPDGDTLTYTQGTGPTNGTLTFNPNGSYTYTPNAGYAGTDSFTYTVNDGRGGSDTATVNITVGARPNSTPDAVNDTGTTAYQTALTGTVATNDTDPDGDTLTYTQGTGPTNGTLTFNANGSYTYTPNAGYTGTDSFTYTVNDGRGGTDTATVNITVGARPNSAPDAVNDNNSTLSGSSVNGNASTNDSDPEGDALTYTLGTGTTFGSVTLNADGSYTYTPNAGFTGTDSFTYAINDGRGGTDTATVTITVTNRAPLNDSIILTRADIDASTVSFNAAPFFRDPEGGALTFSASGLPTGLSIDPATGLITGRVNGGASGATGATAFAVTITATDVHGLSTSQTFQWGITNVQPVAVNDSYTSTGGTRVTGSVASNDSDADQDALSFSLVGATMNGTVVFNADGTFTYTPRLLFSGTDSFSYQVRDANGGISTATATITVTPPATIPSAVACITTFGNLTLLRQLLRG